jgi:hypothetical protein
MKPQKIELTPWHGGECPVADELIVALKLRDGTTIISGNYAICRWTHIKSCSDIIAYAVIETEIIEPPHSTIIPQAVWDVLPLEITQAATGKNGRVYFGNDLILSDNIYSVQYDMTGAIGVIPAKCNWKESLVWRPGYEPKQKKQQPAHGQGGKKDE